VALGETNPQIGGLDRQHHPDFVEAGLFPDEQLLILTSPLEGPAEGPPHGAKRRLHV
jgi:hypothetical protein